MCLVAGLALLFLGAAVWNLFHGETEKATFGFGIGIVLAGFAFAMGREENEEQKFVAFLLENEATLNTRAPVPYQGTPLTLATEVTQFYACVSFLIATIKVPSRYYIRGVHKTGGIGAIYSVVSLVVGWWGFPFGPVYTVQSLYQNMRGGTKKTVAQLLTEIERPENKLENTLNSVTPDTSSAPASLAPPTSHPPQSPWTN